MIETFITSYKLQNTYKVNSILYSIKQFPILKKILPSDIYQKDFFKIIGNILTLSINISMTFAKKLLYLFIIVLIPTLLYKTDTANTYLNIFVFLTLVGGIINNIMLEPSVDKYYAIILMKLDSKKYAISNYYFSLFKEFISFLPFTIIFGFITELPIIISLMMPLFVVFVKVSFVYLDILDFSKTGQYTTNILSKKHLSIALIILCLCAYGLPFVGITLTKESFIFIFLISIIIGIYSIKKINAYNNYSKLFKKILTHENIMIGEVVDKTSISKQASLDILENNNITSNKKGFAFFHDLFIKRHSKLLTKGCKYKSIAIISLFIIILLIVLLIPKSQEGINRIILNYLPYIVLPMYFLNSGQDLTQAMFMNCDHSMLTYRIYRTPKVILGLFKERLKTIIFYNVIPAILIGLSLIVLLFLSGGTTNNLNYLILFVSIVCISIFYSIHYLVMYYLLQPYNANTEIKSSTYHTVQGITYIISYILADFKIPTLYFGLATIVFSITYTLISLLLVYILAPKTFKLRL